MKIILMNINYFLKESLSGFKRSPLLNLASVVSIGLSLLILAVIFVGWWSSEEIITHIQQDAEMAIFYDEELTDEEIANIEEIILNKDGVLGVRHIDADEAYQQMETMMGDEIEVLAQMGDNPFDPFFSTSVDPDRLPELTDEIYQISGIDYVRDNEEIISQFQSLSNMIRYIGVFLTVIVGVTTMIITSQIIRLGILSKESEINMLRLLGAGKGFISLPFVIEGIILGGLGGVLASVLSVGVLSYGQGLITTSVPFIPMPNTAAILPVVIFFLIGLGVVFGLIGSLLSLRFTKEERL